MALTIFGESFNSFAAELVADPTNEFQAYYHGYPNPSLGARPRVGRMQQDRRYISFPGLDGIGTRQLGERRRMIWADIVVYGGGDFIDETMEALLDQFSAQTARDTVTLPGGVAYDGCLLVDDMPLGGENLNQSMYFVHRLVFEQLSRTN